MADRSLESRLREERISFEVLTDAGRDILLRERPGESIPFLMREGTIPYRFQEPYSGKFVYNNGEQFSFLSLGVLNNKEVRGSVFHSDVLELKKKVLGEDYNPLGGGLVRIVPELETVVFYGYSSGLGCSFSKKDLLPVAKYVYEKSNRKIKKALFFSEDSEIRERLMSTESISDPVLRTIYDGKFGLELGSRDDCGFYLGAIGLSPFLNYAYVDLEKEFGGKENGN